MKISIASDHAGFTQKQSLIMFLARLGHEVVDCGPSNDDRVDYPDYAVRVAKDVANGRSERGVLICGTGIGMSIAANKIPGVRAANVTNEEFAALAREHNNANVITLSGRFVSLGQNQRILEAFLSTGFAGGRHAGRVEKINALDKK